MMKRFRTAKWFLVAALAVMLLPAAGRGDDKVILQSGAQNSHHILILFSNGNSMSLILDNSAAALGGADTPDAKMEQAKKVLIRFINEHKSNIYWAFGTPPRQGYAAPATKEFVYMQTGNSGGTDFLCAGSPCPYSQADGVIERWGAATYPNNATLFDPITGITYFSPGRAQNYGAFGCAGGCGGGNPNTVTLNPVYDTNTNTVDKNAQIVETFSSGHYYDFNKPGDTIVQIKKMYQLLSPISNTWVTQNTATVNYVYRWGFIGTGGGTVGSAAATVGYPNADNGNNTLADDRASGLGSTNCGLGWDNATGTLSYSTPAGTSAAQPSVPWSTTVGANIPNILSQLQTLDQAENFNSTNGKYTQVDPNPVEDFLSPAGKTCVGNVIKGGVAPYVSSVESALGSVCTDYNVIWITDSLTAQDAQDPCKVAPTGVHFYNIYYGAQVSGRPTGWPISLAQCTGGSAFLVTNPDHLLAALEGALAIIDENSKDFASATVSSVQTGTAQMAFLATFNATTKRSIWNGRLNGYKLDNNGNIVLGQKTDLSGSLITGIPSNDPAFLKWNAGADLEAMSNMSNPLQPDDTNALTQLTSGQSLTTTSYADTSNDTPQTIPAYYWPGRDIIYSVEQPTAGTIPETVNSLITPASPAWPSASASYPAFPLVPATCTAASTDASCLWFRLKSNYLGLNISSANTLDTRADQDIQFIRGNRDNVVMALNTAGTSGCNYFGAVPNSGTGCDVNKQDPHLYNDYVESAAVLNGEMKLGDIFHSTPTIVGLPHKGAYYAEDLNPDGVAGHDYLSFYNRYHRRRQVIFAGANDGLLHAFDVGAYDRGIGFSATDTCPDGSSPTSATNVTGGCYDLGTGAEIFAYAPRTALSAYDGLAQTVAFTGPTQEWTVDGETAEAPMFISNNSGGTVGSSTYRNWRSVVVGCMREGLRTYTPVTGSSLNRGSYFALDVTQPDSLPAFDPTKPDPTHYTGVPTDSTLSPGCLGSPSSVQSTTAAGCDGDSAGNATEYPRILWEFNDTQTNGVPDPIANPPADLDAAGSPGAGAPDMGETWSTPALGRIELPCGNTFTVGSTTCTNDSAPNNVHACLENNKDACEDKYVSIFGGGFDSNRQNSSGNWIYVINVENGNVLFKANSGQNASKTAIYFGSIAGGPLAIDYNQDGYLDAVYFGDLNGNMWRMRIDCDPATVSFNQSATTTVGTLVYGTRQSVKISSTAGLAGPWQPFLFFTDDRSTTTVDSTCNPATYSYCTELAATCLNGATGQENLCSSTSGPARSIYYSPAAVFVNSSTTGKPVLGIAFSTGERDDILGTSGGAPGSNYQSYRFYYVVDDPASPNVTYTPSNLTNLNALATPTFTANAAFPGAFNVSYAAAAGTACSVSASGWYIPLPGNQYTDANGNSMVGERGISNVIALNGYLYFSTFSPNKPGKVVVSGKTYCNQIGLSRVWQVYYTLCYNGQLNVTGTAAGGFASNPVAYVDQNGTIHVIDATETGAILKESNVGNVTSRIKAWKEQ